MSKIEELINRREVAQKKKDTLVSKITEELLDIENEVVALHTEFKKKLSVIFKGINIDITIGNGCLNILLGKKKKITIQEYISRDLLPTDVINNAKYILSYTPISWNFDDNLLSRKVADKVKKLYIEYFGEL